jgi:RecA/RadA recombinase
LLARLRREGVLRAAVEAERASGRAALPTGVAELDRALGGGLPRGRVTEVTGPLSSGRTAFLLGVLAAATSRGEQVGLIDPADAFEIGRAHV